MLTRERMLGPEIGEDRDHHPADEIAALGIAFGGDRRLERLQGAARVVGIPALERVAHGLVGVRVGRELEPREQAGRDEVGFGVRLKHLAGLVGLTATDEQPAQRDGRARVPRILLEGGAQRLLVARGSELVGLGGHELVEEALDLGRRDGAHELAGDLAVTEDLHGGNAPYAERGREHLVGVHVNLGELDRAAARANGLLERWAELPAGPAPFGPEVHDDGDLARAVDDPLLEIGLGDVEDHESEVSQRRALAIMGRVDESLRGKLLIASPALVDPNFARTVVLITEHSDDGAMGIVLNRPSDATAGEVVPALADVTGDDPLFVGGPVQPEAIVLLAEFSDPSAAAWIVAADVGLASAETDLDELTEVVRRGRLYAGYSGWGAGQLEAEMEQESWIVEPPLPAELFPDDPETLWSDVLARKGGSYALVARMPDDPSLN